MILTNIKHIAKHNHSYTQWKQNISINTYAYTYQHLTCISSFINGKYDCRHKLGKNTYLIKNLFPNQLHRCNVPPNHRPACSLISRQRFHPWVGHDSPRIKELTCLQIAKDNNTTRVHSSTKTTQLGLSGEQQIIQANKVWFIRPSRSWERLNAKIVSSLESYRH